jgi:hypothetical protein
VCAVNPMAGELVTETLDYDGGRRVTVYVPPDLPETSCSPVMVRGVALWRAEFPLIVEWAFGR